ncbi:MAG: NUDIX domain-containing protein [Patescibacteria group bacterium]
MVKKPKTNIDKIKKFFPKKNFIIKEVVKEPTSGGMIFRRGDKNQIEILLIQDAKNRWTIPKGHIEAGETAKETAQREITEETGLKEMTILGYLGKINFRYRRMTSLVLMTTEIFLVRAEGDTSSLKPEEWMNGIKWFPATEALDKIEYEDIGKLILLGLKKIRDQKL